jgi:hypothetical protein
MSVSKYKMATLKDKVEAVVEIVAKPKAKKAKKKVSKKKK